MIKNRFQKARKMIGINQTEIAERLGTSRKSISDYENGRPINSEVLEKLAKNFNVNIHWLITGQGEMFYQGGIGVQQNNVNGMNINNSKVFHTQSKDRFEELCREIRNAEEKKQEKIFYMIKLELLN